LDQTNAADTYVMAVMSVFTEVELNMAADSMWRGC